MIDEVVLVDVFIDLVEMKDDQEFDFFMVELGRLDEMINRFRWVVFVLFNGELEVFLEVVIKFCKEGRSI